MTPRIPSSRTTRVGVLQDGDAVHARAGGGGGRGPAAAIRVQQDRGRQGDQADSERQAFDGVEHSMGRAIFVASRR